MKTLRFLPSAALTVPTVARHWSPRVLALVVVAALALTVSVATAVAFRRPHVASEPATPVPPPGQVWLTPAQAKDAKIAVQAVSEQDVEDTVLTSGTVSLEDQLTGHVFSPVSGRVVRIVAELGERVKKGQALAVLESPDIGSAVSDSHKAEASLIAAEHDLRRKKDLADQKAASAAEVEAAEDTFRTARAEMQRARQKQNLLHVGNVDAVTQTYTLTAPVDGEVLMRNVSPGAEVQGQYSGGATQELFTVGELDTVWVLGDVYEIDLARVHVGARAEVTALAYPDKVFTGKVDWVSGALDPNTRTAKVRCTFANTDRSLRPQMYATVRVSVDEKRALAIPRSAVVVLGEYKVVFVQVGETESRISYERLPVDVDDRKASPWLEVKHGLEAGQRVVTNGGSLLSQRL